MEHRDLGQWKVPYLKKGRLKSFVGGYGVPLIECY